MRRDRLSGGPVCHDVTHVTGDCGLRGLEEIAERVRRLVPSHRDPERFHLEKSEIEHQLRRMAREAR